MTRHRRPVSLLALGGTLSAAGLLGTGEAPAIGQLAPRPPLSAPVRPARRPVEALREAIASNPVTAPYPIAVLDRGGRAVLRGVVGTKVIYDAAIRTAIASGVPFDDELTIDTMAAHEIAARGAIAPGSLAPPIMPAPFLAPTYGAVGGDPPPTYLPIGPVPGGAPGFLYPPPLFGVVDEPFFGFEPPVISYPPYWR
ncbi:hypothetical protein TsocGM_21515, partial [Tautonia sociabilis]